jgi:N-carbamoyl-D-amino-acid hydrolase
MNNDGRRVLRVAGAQMGPTSRHDPREHTLGRLIALLDRAADDGAALVVFPELALTTFFPRWLFTAERELDAFFETAMPNPGVQPLFDRAAARGVGFYLGYAERTPDGRRFNSTILVAPDGAIIGHYRKVHLPGFVEPRPQLAWQQLEKRYFEYGDLGFPAFRAPSSLQGAIFGMMICNDRRWPEAWRELGLQGVEMVCVGYNSAGFGPYGGENEDTGLRTFHSQLVAQANAYMNATWAVSVAKAGVEDGAALIGGSCIVDPAGRIVAKTESLDDAVIVADCDLDACRHGKENMFDFANHRRPMHYGRITAQTGVEEPD